MDRVAKRKRIRELKRFSTHYDKCVALSNSGVHDMCNRVVSKPKISKNKKLQKEKEMYCFISAFEFLRSW